MLFAVDFTLSTGQLVTVGVVFLILCAMSGLWIGGFGYRKKEEREDETKDRVKLYGKVEKAGFTHLSEIILDLIAKDWDGMYREARALVKRLEEPGELLRLTTPSFYWALPQLLEIPEHLGKIASAVGRAQQDKKNGNKE